MLHYFYIALVIWGIYHLTVASHNYRHSTRHRSWLHRVWISASIPLPLGFRGRLGHRL